MRCAGCSQLAKADSIRFGKPWCASCAAGIDFEERLANQNGVVLADVFMRDGERVAVLVEPAGEVRFSDANYQRIALTERDIVPLLTDAMAALRQSILVSSDGALLVTRHGPERARKLLDLAAEFRLVLGDDKDTNDMLELARSIADRAKG